MLKSYLDGAEASNLPVLSKKGNYENFASEREILYQVLFDMKRDMNELKLLVNDIIQQNLMLKLLIIQITLSIILIMKYK